MKRLLSMSSLFLILFITLSLAFVDISAYLLKIDTVFFRTKSIKGSVLVQLVESYRNLQGQPRQRVIRID